MQMQFMCPYENTIVVLLCCAKRFTATTLFGYEVVSLIIMPLGIVTY